MKLVRVITSAMMAVSAVLFPQAFALEAEAEISLEYRQFAQGGEMGQAHRSFLLFSNLAYFGRVKKRVTA
ncbi:hypothetical protein CS022_01110 [Veronia nyctiphanis]|uniref:Uncharacterized protein n=1 Tax=Veronia nyctiphanis TaxID=1278244 RepID=A0A4Q0YU70_9GAMM|nr:hypothetical protein [Veronia nyctiphanis]RXJ74842.1 hypothetical protein CS022_01110 [Veronia nyctiphanis]